MEVVTFFENSGAFAMKKKMQTKKIVLSKETLRSLDDHEQSFVNGGISGSACGNDTCYILCKGTLYC